METFMPNDPLVVQFCWAGVHYFLFLAFGASTGAISKVLSMRRTLDITLKDLLQFIRNFQEKAGLLQQQLTIVLVVDTALPIGSLLRQLMNWVYVKGPSALLQ